MKILIISPTQSGIGGIAQHVTNLSNFLKNNSHQVEIISSENTFYIPVKGLKNPTFAISAFFKTLSRKKYDIVHAQNPLTALAMKNVKAKKVISLQGMYADNISMLHGKELGRLSAKFEKHVLNWADAIIVSSQDMYEIYSRLSSNVYFIPNAIDISSFQLNDKRLFQKQVIYAARLSKEKGIFDVIEMAKNLPKEIDLVIIGDGPEKEKVAKLAENQSNIHYLGVKPKTQTIELILGSDIMLQPSLLEAGTSTSILEAMACHTTVIATPIGGNKEAIRHLKTGILVKTHSPKEILENILELFNNYQLKKEITQNAFEEVKKFDWGNIGKMYLNIYRQLIKNQKN